MPFKTKKKSHRENQRPSSSNHIQNCNGIEEANSLTQARSPLALLSDQPTPVTALVQNVMHGVPNHYPTNTRAGINKSTETATVEIVKRRHGIHIILYKHNTITSETSRLATFKLIEGGDFNLEAMVYRVTHSFEIVKYSQVANKRDIFWHLELAASPVNIDQTKRFWATLCHHLEMSSIQKLLYVNLARPQRIVSADTQSTISHSKRDDDNTDKQQTLTISVPFEEHPWVFTNHLADPEFLKLREAIKRGESTAVDPDEEAADGGNQSSKAARSKKPKAAKKPKNQRRHARRVAAGLTSP